ncbi:MAG: GNAT family N-acetyltransferase, partial [Cyanobacteria bacterium PR.023]|nr:GNAT family N-acetyltransferase [Cyanobacteria bacterium PR.023]
KPEYRGKGMGGQLWLNMRDTLRERLNPGTAIGIDGVFNMQQTYAKTGFVFSHRTLRMEGIAVNNIDSCDFAAIKPVAAEEIEALIEADAHWFGFKRQRLLSAWLKMKDSHSLVYKDASKILGYGTIRPCQKGFKIGPLFATSADIADQLYRALTAKVSGQVIYLDVPEINQEAMALAAKHKLSECFGCARMYLGPAPALDYNQIYGSTTYELG